MVNEFKDRVYDCGALPSGSGCHCMFQSELQDQCKIAGQGVLDSYDYDPSNFARNVGIMFAIIAGYRLAGWAVLMIKKN